MTTKAKATLIGHKALYHVGAMSFLVEIQDHKTSYGRDRYLIEPIAGKGQVWTEKITLE